MKNEILDSPLFDKSRYDFEDILKEDETILWRGQPATTEKLFSLADYFMFGLIIFFLYPLQFAPNELIGYAIGGILLFLFYLGRKIYRITTIRNIRYAITSNRIFWSTKKTSPKEAYFIDFENIKWAEMEDDAIFIRPKDYDLVTFQTYNYKDLSLRNKPTLENIENMSEVYDLIEKHIYKNYSK